MSLFLFTLLVTIATSQANPMFAPNSLLTTDDASNAFDSVLGQMDGFGDSPFEMYSFDKRHKI